MMNTRRQFFKLLAGAALTPVAAKAAMAIPSVPMLWGDGVHDDTKALNALLSGNVVEFSNTIPIEGIGWHGRTCVLPHGLTYRLNGTPVHLGPRSDGVNTGLVFNFNDSTIVQDSAPPCHIYIEDLHDSRVMSGTFTIHRDAKRGFRALAAITE